MQSTSCAEPFAFRGQNVSFFPLFFKQTQFLSTFIWNKLNFSARTAAESGGRRRLPMTQGAEGGGEGGGRRRLPMTHLEVSSRCNTLGLFHRLLLTYGRSLLTQ